MTDEAHRWVVDSIEESAASIEVDGDRMFTVPQWALPPKAREGDLLSIRARRSADGRTSELTISVDADATKKAYKDSARQVRE